MISGAMAFPIGDTAAKHLAEVGYSTVWLSWARLAVGGLLLWRFLLRAHFRGNRVQMRDLYEQSVRAFLIVMATVFFITALSYVPLADVVGAYFAAPIVAAILAVWLLREPFSKRIDVAVIIGFVGMALIIRPSVTMNVGYLLALGAGICMGGFVIATRWSETKLTPMAQSVPVGILFLGSLSSPDIFAPAIIPVAAGKNTAKTIQKLLPENPFSAEPLNSPQLKESLKGSCIEPS